MHLYHTPDGSWWMVHLICRCGLRNAPNEAWQPGAIIRDGNGVMRSVRLDQLIACTEHGSC